MVASEVLLDAGEEPFEGSKEFLDASVFKEIDFGNVNGLLIPENGDNDRESDCGLSGRHRDHEKDEYLPGCITHVLSQGHQRQVDRVEHELDRHKDDNHISSE